jgi:hypothetical protein
MCPTRAQDLFYQWRECRQGAFLVDKFRFLEDKFLFVPAQATLASGLKIAQPIDISAIGQDDHKAIFQSPDHDGYLIGFSAAPANVAQEREWTMSGMGHIAQNWIDEALDKDPQTFIVFAHVFYSFKIISLMLSAGA